MRNRFICIATLSAAVCGSWLTGALSASRSPIGSDLFLSQYHGAYRQMSPRPLEGFRVAQTDNTLQNFSSNQQKMLLKLRGGLNEFRPNLVQPQKPNFYKPEIEWNKIEISYQRYRLVIDVSKTISSDIDFYIFQKSNESSEDIFKHRITGPQTTFVFQCRPSWQVCYDARVGSQATRSCLTCADGAIRKLKF
jgi:hypothetical protein